MPNRQWRDIQAVCVVQRMMEAEAEMVVAEGGMVAIGLCCSITGRDRMEPVLGAGRERGAFGLCCSITGREGVEPVSGAGREHGAFGLCCSIPGRERSGPVLGAGREHGGAGVASSGAMSGHLVVNRGNIVGSKMAELVLWATERAVAR